MTMTTKKTSTSKEVTLFGDKNAGPPAHVVSGQGLGNENVGAGDFGIPRLSILQGLSPQVGSVEGAVPGKFHVSVVDAIYDRIYAVNLLYELTYPIFRTREQGGGFEAVFNNLPEAQAYLETLPNKLAYEIVETATHTLLLLDDEGEPIQPVQFGMSKSKLRVSREWNTAIHLQGAEADRFASVWDLTTVKQKNNKGEFFNLHYDFAGWASEALHAFARKTYLEISGKAREAA